MLDVLYACSAAVQQCLMTSSVWEAIRTVDTMAVLDTGLNQSGCFHLQDFLQETLHFWHKIIKDRLARYFSTQSPYTMFPFVTLYLNVAWIRNTKMRTLLLYIVHCIVLCLPYELKPSLQFFHSDFEKVLTQLQWPIVSPPTQSLTPTANHQEINSQLELLVTQLLALQTSYPSVWASGECLDK